MKNHKDDNVTNGKVSGYVNEGMTESQTDLDYQNTNGTRVSQNNNNNNKSIERRTDTQSSFDFICEYFIFKFKFICKFCLNYYTIQTP